jgi:hypothetical protein
MACQVHINDHDVQQFSSEDIDSTDGFLFLVFLCLSLLAYLFLLISLIPLILIVNMLSSIVIYLFIYFQSLMHPYMSICHKIVHDFVSELHIKMTHLLQMIKTYSNFNYQTIMKFSIL